MRGCIKSILIGFLWFSWAYADSGWGEVGGEIKKPVVQKKQEFVPRLDVSRHDKYDKSCV